MCRLSACLIWVILEEILLTDTILISADQRKGYTCGFYHYASPCWLLVAARPMLPVTVVRITLSRVAPLGDLTVALTPAAASNASAQLTVKIHSQEAGIKLLELKTQNHDRMLDRTLGPEAVLV